MSIQLNLENTIGFERPLTRVVKQNIRITNPHSKPVAFKVKTTAPKLYCVRPNSDIIPANGFADIQIMLQAFREEPPLDQRCKDKFLILSTLVEGSLEQMELTELWSHVEKNAKDTINEKKLRCVFVQPSENNASETNGTIVPPAVVPVPVAASTVTKVHPHTNNDTTITTANTTSTASNEEKFKQLEEELEKYKKKVEEMREAEPIIVEKVQVKTTGYPISIFILFALLAAAVAYFLQANNNQDAPISL